MMHAAAASAVASAATPCCRRFRQMITLLLPPARVAMPRWPPAMIAMIQRHDAPRLLRHVAYFYMPMFFALSLMMIRYACRSTLPIICRDTPTSLLRRRLATIY